MATAYAVSILITSQFLITEEGFCRLSVAPWSFLVEYCITVLYHYAVWLRRACRAVRRAQVTIRMKECLPLLLPVVTEHILPNTPFAVPAGEN